MKLFLHQFIAIWLSIIKQILHQSIIQLWDLDLRYLLSNPQHMDSISITNVYNTRDICIDRNFLFYIDPDGKFGILDCFDPYNIESSIVVPLHGYESDIFIEGTTAYIASANFSLVALNIVDPANPFPIAYYDSIISGYQTIAANNYLFLKGPFDTIEVLNPQLPIEYVTSYTAIDSCKDMSVHNNRLYLATGGGLEVVDITNPSSPIKFDELTNPSHLSGVDANNNNTVYCYSSNTLYTIDVTTQGAMSVLDSLTLPYNIDDFHCVGNQIVTVGDHQVNVFDVSNPSSIEETGTRSFSGLIPKVTTWNNFCFLQERGVGIHIIDLAAFPTLQIIDTISETYSNIKAIQVTDEYIIIAKFDAGVDFYSYEIEQIPVIDPTTPTPTTSPQGTPGNLMLWLGIGLSAGVVTVVVPLSIVIGRRRMIAKRELIKRDAAITQLTSCYHCGYPIRKDAITCEDCGKEIIRCVVCKLPVSLGDTLGQCSLCEAKAHYEHMLDWVQKRGKCPHCQQKVPEDSVIAISSGAEPKKKNDEDLED
ncbi:MAG: hypothetical protein ACTSSK_02320 [Candidatus Heimdallarchaeota archaeon]